MKTANTNLDSKLSEAKKQWVENFDKRLEPTMTALSKTAVEGVMRAGYSKHLQELESRIIALEKQLSAANKK